MNHEEIYKVMCDFRKGGLNPIMYVEFLELIEKLPQIIDRKPNDYKVFDKFNLSDITEKDFPIIMREVMKRGIENNKFCWHPKASNETCNIDSSGKIIISAAHSIQNNGVLSEIVENGHVMSYNFNKGQFEGQQLGKNYASIFWGFCNKHDSIFRPIENSPYTGTPEQNFLFAYRGFVVSAHKKKESSVLMNFGALAENDIVVTKKIFDSAILANDFSLIESEKFELPAFYPIAVSSAFYLDYDFEGNPIPHSDDRIEDIFVTFFPSGNKSYFLISYFSEDRHLYGNLGAQLRKRNNLKSDITILIAAHAENIYFNPTYYKTFIEKHEEVLMKILFESQMNIATISEKDRINDEFSLTPKDYLNNPYEINYFGY